MKSLKFCTFGIIFACLNTAASTYVSEETTENTLNNSTEEAGSGNGEPVIINGTDTECGPAAIEDFPRPIIDAEMRSRGGIIVHLIVAALMVLSISILCDEYFVPALQVLIDCK